MLANFPVILTKVMMVVVIRKVQNVTARDYVHRLLLRAASWCGLNLL